MYYYIAEPVITRNEKKRIEEIKSLLSQVGIAGEFAVASPARTVEEHLELAFSKGFTTIVGIGSDALVSRVAATMLKKRYDRAVIGVIPFEPSQVLWQMIGIKNIPHAVETLRARLLLPIDVVHLGEDQAIITPASIRLDSPLAFKLGYRQAELSGLFTDMLIDPSGEVKIWDRTQGRQAGWLSRLFSSQSADLPSITKFTADRWIFASEKPCQLLVGSQVVAETPFDVLRRPKALKLIVNRAKIAPEKEIKDNEES